ncbi:MAG: Rieske 2Fe-2S domain-containing protein [Burkholderiales bacterium]|nr:Rieske 2Fe-2S domain-containing protein [Burkholderiales bacterium]
MLTREENELLCRVEGEAPMGQLMRRHWLPACLIEEVPDADGTPVAIRLLGEDLVAFRDSDGRVGVMDRYCPHRHASLVFGRNEDCGLRCLYHGWKIDVEGNVVEMPSEPAAACAAQKVRHTAYPTHEHGGFVWAYMGPKEAMPAFAPPPWAPTAATRVSIVKIAVDCNWAQILEGAIDSAHSSTLHSTEMPPARVDGAKATAQHWLRPSTDKAPRMLPQQTDFGFKYAAVRRPIQNAATHDYVRISVFVAPATVLIPPNNLYNLANVNVPIDDTHTMFHFIAWSEDDKPGIETEAWRKFCAAQPGIDLDAGWRNTRTLANNYLQDRQAMRLGSFTGIRGIPNQDISMWETMGPITDRSRDRLGASDVAIVEFRRVMVDAARRFRDGGPALGTGPLETPQARLRSFEGIVAKGVAWQTLGTVPADAALSPQPASVTPP